MSETYFGRKVELEFVRLLITDPREANVINVVGAYGLGRSRFLRCVEEEINKKSWEFSQTNDPIIITIQGRSFTVDDKFTVFLSKHIKEGIPPDLRNLTQSDDSVDLLWILSKEDYPIIIIVDDFDRIMERIKLEEVQNLNRFRLPGVHYILVTDHRRLEEIQPPIFEESEFFKDARIVDLKPIHHSDAVDFINSENEQNMEKKGIQLTEEQVNMVVKIAGGHLALLNNLYKYLLQYIQNSNSNSGVWSEEQRRRFLHFLPEESTLKYYIRKIIEPVKKIEKNTEKDMLISIALREHKGFLEPGLQRKFEVMGVLRDKKSEISGELLAYSILDEVIAVNFSEPERVVFEKIMDKKPGLVTQDELYALLKHYMDEQEGKSEHQKQYLDSTLARIRKKINSLRNFKSFSIENERGLGYYLESQVLFEDFIERGAEAYPHPKVS